MNRHMGNGCCRRQSHDLKNKPFAWNSLSVGSGIPGKIRRKQFKLLNSLLKHFGSIHSPLNVNYIFYLLIKEVQALVLGKNAGNSLCQITV